jgi:hypothetical protein
VTNVLERTPEIYPIARKDSGRILPTLQHFAAHEMPPMYVLYRIVKPAPDGKVSIMRAVTAADVRAGRFRKPAASEQAALAPFQESRE